MAVLRSCYDEPWCGFHAFYSDVPGQAAHREFGPAGPCAVVYFHDN